MEGSIGSVDAAGGQPEKVGVALSDILTGLYASNGILAALQERGRSGKGQYIDVALLDVTAACLANQATNYLVGGMVPQRLGNAHPNIIFAIGRQGEWSNYHRDAAPT